MKLAQEEEINNICDNVASDNGPLHNSSPVDSPSSCDCSADPEVIYLPSYNCPKCGRKFIRDHQCSSCEKYFENQSDLFGHKCSDESIGKSFGSIAGIEDPNPTKPFSCDSCGAGFVRKYNLTCHMKSIHNVKNVVS